MVRLIPVQRHAYQPAARVLASAFIDEPVALAIYGHLSPAHRLHNLLADFYVEIEVSTRLGCPLQCESVGQVVAAAVIYPPGAYPLPWIERARIFAGSILNHHRYDLRLYQRWLDAAGRFHPTCPHYYLEYLGVTPGHQGCGFGSAILKHLAALADGDKVPCYLETASQRNVSLYTHYGFQVIAAERIIATDAWFMMRPPVNIRQTA